MRTWETLGLCVALGSAAGVAHSPAAADGTEAPPTGPAQTAEKSSSGFAIGAAPGLGLYKGKYGLWLELFLAHDFKLSETFAVRVEVGPLLSAYSDSDTYQVLGTDGVDFTDEVRGFGGLARSLLDYGFSPRWSLRAGILAGVSHISMKSTLCGSSSLTNPFYGVSLGPAARFGPAWEVAVLGDFATYPLLRCAKSQPAPTVHQRDELTFDDPTIVLSGRLAYRW